MAYGSNADPVRFSHYLTGGRPAGARRAMRGARDPSPPRRRRVVWLPRRLHFAGTSTVWGGGMAFLDHDEHPTARTPAVGHLLSVEQFEDVLAQENRREPTPLPDDLEPGEVRAVGPGRYDAVVHCGTIDGHPALTFTGPSPVAPDALAAPAAAYVATIAAGLRAVAGLEEEEVVAHLLAAPGARPHWDEATLREAVRTGPPR